MTERLSATYRREEFSAAVKRAALARADGHCERCGDQLVKGKYRYNHKVPTRRGGPPTLDNCEILCHDGPGSCDYDQTYGVDLPGIAAVKRYGKNRLPLDIGRPNKKPSKFASQKSRPMKHNGLSVSPMRHRIASPGFAKQSRPMPKSDRKIPSRPMRGKK